MAIPWVSGTAQRLVMLLGIGGVVCLLGFDLYIGVEEKDYDLAADFMLLNLTKAILFFGVSWIVEKIVLTFIDRAKQQNKSAEWQEKDLTRNFDRNMRGLKDPDTKHGKR